MIKIKEKMLSYPFSDIREGFVVRARIESGRIADARQWMLGNGFELVAGPADQLLTDDGREILHAHGKSWALKPEVHAQRLAEAMEQATQRDAAKATPQPAPPATICETLIDGQLCGGTLVQAPVCPLCTLGKSGVAATLTCDVCGHVTAIMRGDA